MVASDRSYLYVPAHSEGMLEGALGRGADALIIDLEDGVPDDRKETARRAAGTWIADNATCRQSLWVRVNPDGALMALDLESIVVEGLHGVYLPKVSTPDDVALLATMLDRLENERGLATGSILIAPLLETAGSILNMTAIASAERVSHLAIGETDLAADLGMHPSPDGRELHPIRISAVVASAASGLNPPIGPVQTTFRDLDLLRTTSAMFRRMGYGGRASVHPMQVPVINEAFTPPDAEVEWARDVVDRFTDAAASGSAVTTAGDGSLIDEAVVRRARATLEAQHRIGEDT